MSAGKGELEKEERAQAEKEGRVGGKREGEGVWDGSV